MDDSPSEHELDRFIARMFNDTSDPHDNGGNATELLNQFVRDVEDDRIDVGACGERWAEIQQALRREDRLRSATIARSIANLGEAIAEFEDHDRPLSEPEQAHFEELVKARRKLQDLLFPSERPVASYHCPGRFIADPEEVRSVLDQTPERFTRVAPSRWESRDSGLCCHTDGERFFDNLRLTSRTIHWDAAVPRALEMLLTVRQCTPLRGTSELRFIGEVFEQDQEVQELLAIVANQEQQWYSSVAQSRLEDAVRFRDDFRRNYERLNRLCVEREPL